MDDFLWGIFKIPRISNAVSTHTHNNKDQQQMNEDIIQIAVTCNLQLYN